MLTMMQVTKRKIERDVTALKHDIARQPPKSDLRQDWPHDAGDQDHQPEANLENAVHPSRFSQLATTIGDWCPFGLSCF